jgi:hypothetical protein
LIDNCRSLNLSGNPLRNSGIVVLAEGLVKNRGSLSTLNIAHTEFGHCGTNDLTGVKMLSAALKLSEHLTSCNASGNMIGSDGCQLLLTCLAGATHIRELEITPIGIDKPIFDMLLTFLSANQPEPKKKVRSSALHCIASYCVPCSYAPRSVTLIGLVDRLINSVCRKC